MTSEPAPSSQGFLAFLRSVPSPVWGLAIVSAIIWGALSGPFRAGLADPLVMDARVYANVAPDALGRSPFTLVGDWKAAPEGGLSPAGEGSITFELAAGPWDRVRVRFWGDAAVDWRIQARQGFARHTLLRATAGGWNELELRITEDGVREPLRIEMTPVAPGRGRIETIDARASATMLNTVPSAAGVVAVVALPWAVFLIMMAGPGWKLPRAALFASATGGMAAMGLWYAPQHLASAAQGVLLAWSLAAVLAIRQLVLRAGQDAEARRRFAALAEAAAVGVLLMTALMVRNDAFLEARGLALRPDAAGYVEIAATRSFYDSQLSHAPWAREPLFPGLIRFVWSMMPDTLAATRFAMMLLSLGALGAVYAALRTVVEAPGALLAAGVLAVNRDWAVLASDVLRTDSVLLAMACLVLVRQRLGETRWWRAGWWGVLCGVLVLLQLGNALFVAVVSVWEVLRRRWHPGEAALAAALMIVPLLPHLAFNHRLHDSGNILYSSAVHTRYFANREFAGTPSFPSRAEVAADPYAGGVMGLGTYLGLYPAPEVPVKVVKGYVSIFVTEMTRNVLFPGPAWVLLPGLVGAAFLAMRRQAWFLVIWAVVFAFPFAIVASGGIDWRLPAPVAPVVCLTWALGIWGGAERAWREWAPGGKAGAPATGEA